MLLQTSTLLSKELSPTWCQCSLPRTPEYVRRDCSFLPMHRIYPPYSCWMNGKDVPRWLLPYCEIVIKICCIIVWLLLAALANFIFQIKLHLNMLVTLFYVSSLGTFHRWMGSNNGQYYHSLPAVEATFLVDSIDEFHFMPSILYILFYHKTIFAQSFWCFIYACRQ